MKSPTRPRGRPRGLSPKGADARRRLYDAALELMAEQGYGETTLRDVAARAGVSVGLLYRYFPSKRAVLIRLYDELSAEYAAKVSRMPRGRWPRRFTFALTTSLEVLESHRELLKALVPVLVGDPEDGLFSARTAFSRLRVQAAFHDAVANAVDAPRPELAASLGRILYLLHLSVILWWLLDRSPHQVATRELVALIDRTISKAPFALRLPMLRGLIRSGDALFRQALLEEVG